MTTALPKDAQARPPPDIAEQIEALTAANEVLTVLCYTIMDRMSRAEETIVRLATSMGCDAPSVPPVERTSVKQAAGRLGCSKTRIHQWIDDGTLDAIKDHGRVLVAVSLVEKLYRERNPTCS
jgi:excisionase family DNA binding protein